MRFGPRLAISGPLRFTGTTVNDKPLSEVRNLTHTMELKGQSVVLRASNLVHREDFTVTQP